VSEEIAFPELQDAILDRATLSQLFCDLSALAEVMEVRVKGGATALATDEVPTLARAHEVLASGEALGVQIRYRYAGRVWLDTLLQARGGVRLVRVPSV
jgi:hypothetical protein